VWKGLETITNSLMLFVEDLFSRWPAQGNQQAHRGPEVNAQGTFRQRWGYYLETGPPEII